MKHTFSLTLPVFSYSTLSRSSYPAWARQHIVLRLALCNSRNVAMLFYIVRDAAHSILLLSFPNLCPLPERHTDTNDKRIVVADKFSRHKDTKEQRSSVGVVTRIVLSSWFVDSLFLPRTFHRVFPRGNHLARVEHAINVSFTIHVNTVKHEVSVSYWHGRERA